MFRYDGRGSRRRSLQRYGIVVAITCLLALLLLQTSPRVNDQIEPVRTAASDQLYFMTQANMLNQAKGRSAKDQQIAALEAKVQELSQYQAMATSMADKLKVYEALLRIQGEPASQQVTARVMAEAKGPFSEALLANAGRINGIENGFYAENEGGLVGRVVQVGERSSRILKITDFNSRVPIMGEASGLRAIMYGGRDGLGDLTDRPEPGNFLQGERILTSGEGGLFPRGLIVGTVVNKGKTQRVALAMQSGQLVFVRLKPPGSIAAPETNPASGSGVSTPLPTPLASIVGEGKKPAAERIANSDLVNQAFVTAAEPKKPRPTVQSPPNVPQQNANAAQSASPTNSGQGVISAGLTPGQNDAASGPAGSSLPAAQPQNPAPVNGVLGAQTGPSSPNTAPSLPSTNPAEPRPNGGRP